MQRNKILYTMSSGKLKIYACSGIGNADSKYDYWLDNTQTVSNTQAVNSLLSMINLCYSEAINLGLRTEEVVDRLNQIDLYSVAMYYAQEYQHSQGDLHRAGQVIGCLLDQGVFSFDSLSNDERDRHLDEVFEKVSDVISDDSLTASQSFSDWWKENIEDKNKVFLDVEKQNEITEILRKSSKSISGIGAAGDEWENNEDLAQYLNNASEYFLYTYFTDEQLKSLPQSFRAKKVIQNKTYDYCKAMFVGVYGSEESMREVIRAGIINYFKATPEEVCRAITNNNGKYGGVGIAVSAILSIISAVLTFVATVVTAICQCVAKVKVAKYQAIDSDTASAATPNPEDFDGLNFDGTTKKSTIWAVTAAVAALALIFKD